jgi:hypothetical protein
MRLLAHLLNRFIRNGELRLIAADGSVHLFGGHGPGPGPTVTVRLHDPRLYIKLFLNPELHAGEAYMNGTLTFEDGSDVGDFMELFAANRGGLAAHPGQMLLRRLWRAAKSWHQSNPATAAAANARHHYDLSTDLYRMFLDDDLNYSCAVFEHPATDTLEQAQLQKLQRATAKLRLRPGMTVAEIGSGWGAFAIHIAATTGARVTAINVSPEQLHIARGNAAAAGVEGLVEFRELDYRALEGRFDRVVSVGMMEHVGIGHFDAYFGKIRDLLADNGFAFVHCIGRREAPARSSANTSSPAPMCRPCPRCSPPPNDPVYGLPTWRCYGCTTTTRCSTGAGASRPTAPVQLNFMTSASAACGNTTLPPSRSVSPTGATWCSSYCCRRRSTRCQSCAARSSSISAWRHGRAPCQTRS